jgi:hypothetical protein
VSPFGASETTFVDLIWMRGSRLAAVLEIVDESFSGDPQMADGGLVGQATDAVARRITGL